MRAAVQIRSYIYFFTVLTNPFLTAHYLVQCVRRRRRRRRLNVYHFGRLAKDLRFLVRFGVRQPFNRDWSNVLDSSRPRGLKVPSIGTSTL